MRVDDVASNMLQVRTTPRVHGARRGLRRQPGAYTRPLSSST